MFPEILFYDSIKNHRDGKFVSFVLFVVKTNSCHSWFETHSDETIVKIFES